jgi:hypothetical protein
MSDTYEVKSLISRVQKLETKPEHEEWVLARLRMYPAYASQDIPGMWDLISSDIEDKPPEYTLVTSAYLSKLLCEEKIFVRVVNDYAIVNGKYVWPVLAISAPLLRTCR